MTLLNLICILQLLCKIQVKFKAERDTPEPELAIKQTAINTCITAKGSNMPFPADALHGVPANDRENKQPGKNGFIKVANTTAVSSLPRNLLTVRKTAQFGVSIAGIAKTFQPKRIAMIF